MTTICHGAVSLLSLKESDCVKVEVEKDSKELPTNNPSHIMTTLSSYNS